MPSTSKHQPTHVENTCFADILHASAYQNPPATADYIIHPRHYTPLKQIRNHALQQPQQPGYFRNFQSASRVIYHSRSTTHTINSPMAPVPAKSLRPRIRCDQKKQRTSANYNNQSTYVVMTTRPSRKQANTLHNKPRTRDSSSTLSRPRRTRQLTKT